MSGFNPKAWQMNRDQYNLYWRLWSEACAYQGWTTAKGMKSAQIDAQRRAEHLKIFGFVKSAKDINAHAEFTAVKNHFGVLAGQIKAAIDSDHPELEVERRILHKVRSELIPALKGLHPDPHAYVQRILRTEFKVQSLDDLSAVEQPAKGTKRDGTPKRASSPVQRFLWTLTARIEHLKKEALEKSDNEIPPGVEPELEGQPF